MVVVPTGDFMMGSPATEEGRTSSEGPQHKVTIAAPFAVSKFEVTFDVVGGVRSLRRLQPADRR